MFRFKIIHNSQLITTDNYPRLPSTVYRLSLLFLLISHHSSLISQLYAQQTVKGVILDQHLRIPLPGATVVVLDTDPVQGAVTDAEGLFRIERVALGRVGLRISYPGYKEVLLRNIAVDAGRQTNLSIELEEQSTETEQVVVVAKTDKRRPLNTFSTVSTRSFSVEETSRFAASINDPARMATSFAGVVQMGDGNGIAIRGNAPNGLLWRLEGIDIPNPNHFAAAGSSGGGICILSAQLLSHSDFSTGAFAAEYGNALSGVFDLRLRKGNQDKHEFTVGASFIGLEAAAEGPIRLGQRTGSYLVNYRYSTLTILQRLLASTSLPVGDAPTNFQDLSFNISLPTRRLGQFTLFGFGGLSGQEEVPVLDTLRWRSNPNLRNGAVNSSNTGMTGVTHTLILGKKTALRTVVAASGYEIIDKDTRQETLDLQRTVRDNRFADTKWIASMVLNHSFSPRVRLRTGAYASRLQYNLLQRRLDARQVLQDRIRESDFTVVGNAFAQVQAQLYAKAEQRLTANAGLHAMHLWLNNKNSIEPRASMTWQWTKNQWISLAFGRHGQVQPLGTYFSKVEVNRVVTQPNRNLDFTRADHWVLSYDLSFGTGWHIRPEVYYQSLNGVPVSATRATWFSTINQLEGYSTEVLKSTGKGKNYGLELTVERFLNQGWYTLGTFSLYDSQYQASDRVWRPTRWNAQKAATLLGGKEWALQRSKKQRLFAADAKMVWLGGLRSLPIDFARSKTQRETVYNTNTGYSDQLPDYFRLDLRVSLKRQFRRLTTTTSLDIQNTTNRANAYRNYYDLPTGEERYRSLIRFTPILGWKVNF